jgi:hypothetical protein
MPYHTLWYSNGAKRLQTVLNGAGLHRTTLDDGAERCFHGKSPAYTEWGQNFSLPELAGFLLLVVKRSAAGREPAAVCNEMECTGMILMPLRLDLRLWRWKITVRISRVS